MTVQQEVLGLLMPVSWHMHPKHIHRVKYVSQIGWAAACRQAISDDVFRDRQPDGGITSKVANRKPQLRNALWPPHESINLISYTAGVLLGERFQVRCVQVGDCFQQFVRWCSHLIAARQPPVDPTAGSRDKTEGSINNSTCRGTFKQQ